MKLASPNGIESIVHRLLIVMSEDLHTHTIKWKCESERYDSKHYLYIVKTHTMYMLATFTCRGMCTERRGSLILVRSEPRDSKESGNGQLMPLFISYTHVHKHTHTCMDMQTHTQHMHTSTHPTCKRSELLEVVPVKSSIIQ